MGRFPAAWLAAAVLLGGADARPAPGDLVACLAATEAAIIVERCSAALTGSDLGAAARQSAWQRRGIGYHVQGAFDLAVADFTAALGLAPDDAPLRVLRANALFMTRDYGAAVADYDAALTRRPTEATYLTLRGNARRLAGDHDGAVRDFTAALAVDDGLFEALLNRGAAYRALGNYRAALDDFARAAALGPNDPRPRTAGARVRFFEGDFAASADGFDAAEALRPGDPFTLAWRFFARARASQAGRVELQAAGAAIDRGRWPGLLLGLLFGERSFAELEDTAHTRDRRETAERLTDLYFFQGQLDLIAGRGEQARRRFEQALAAGDPAPVSHVAARVELARLGPPAR